MPPSPLDSLPPLNPGDDFEDVRRLVAKSRTKVVVMDDDPTGTQTVHGIDVLANWTVASLSAALADPRPCFYLLTNSRSLPGPEAEALIRTIGFNLSTASRNTGIPFVVISRSDSTLRGHFFEELRAIEESLACEISGIIVIPSFFEGGRYTINDVHYVANGAVLVPAAETEFARDPAFGYIHSNLKEWIEEKTSGAVKSTEVESIDIQTLRSPGGAGNVLRRLLEISVGTFVIVNAAAYRDLEVFAHGLMQAEATGRRYLMRTASSFVRVRAGIAPIPLMAPSSISGPGRMGGLVVVGSYVARTTAQLESLLTLPGVVGIELVVDRLGESNSRKREIARAATAASGAMLSGHHAVIFSSRSEESSLGKAGELGAGRIVSNALVGVVQSIGRRPRLLVAKGGITSSDVAIHGLGMRRALVLGQVHPGVPVWEMGPETRFPELRLVIWPGNVGEPNALRDLIRLA